MVVCGEAVDDRWEERAVGLKRREKYKKKREREREREREHGLEWFELMGQDSS